MAIRFPITKIDSGGFPKIQFKGRSIPAIAYTSYLPQARYYKEMAERGIGLFCFPAYLAGRGINIHSGIGPFRNGIWKSDREFDFADIAHDFKLILEAAPEALVLMRLHLDVPLWWEENIPMNAVLSMMELELGSHFHRASGLRIVMQF